MWLTFIEIIQNKTIYRNIFEHIFKRTPYLNNIKIMPPISLSLWLLFILFYLVSVEFSIIFNIHIYHYRCESTKSHYNSDVSDFEK